MPRGGHFGCWKPLPKDFFRSRWKQFYKRSYRKRSAYNEPDYPKIHDPPMFNPDSVPSPWKLHYSNANFKHEELPADQRYTARRMYRYSLPMFLEPYRSSTTPNPAVREALARSLDPGRRWRSDSGLGRPETGSTVVSEGQRQLEALPVHLHNIFKDRASRGEESMKFLQTISGTVPETFAIRRLYQLCEEKEIVWDKGQRPVSSGGRARSPTSASAEDDVDRGRFPFVQEEASLVDELGLETILKLRHKTNRRRSPRYIEVVYQMKKGHKQYLRRRHMVMDEVKARMGVLKQSMQQE